MTRKRILKNHPKLTKPCTSLEFYPPMKFLRADKVRVKRTYRTKERCAEIKGMLQTFFQVDEAGRATVADGDPQVLDLELYEHVYHDGKGLEVERSPDHDTFLTNRMLSCGQQRMLVHLYRTQAIPMQYISTLLGVHNSNVAMAARRNVDYVIPCSLDQFIYDVHRTNNMTVQERRANTKHIWQLQGTPLFDAYMKAETHTAHACKYKTFAMEFEQGRLLMCMDYMPIVKMLRQESSELHEACKAIIITDGMFVHDNRRGVNTMFTYQQQGMIMWMIRYMSYKLLSKLTRIRECVIYSLKARYDHEEWVIPCTLDDLLMSLALYPVHDHARIQGELLYAA